MLSGAAVLALPLSVLALQQHTALRSARAQPGAVATAAGPESAIRGLRMRLSGDSVAEAVSLELVDADDLPGRAATGVIVVGSQAGVIAFADRVEANAPVARFRDWTITADPAGVRLTGTVIVPRVAAP